MISSAGSNFSTFFALVRFRAASLDSANRTAFTYLKDGENVTGELTYAQLDELSRSLAARLQGLTSPGDRVLLVYPPGLDYIVAFFACVYAGVVAVPALPPNNPRALPRLRLIAADAQATVALTSSDIRTSIDSLRSDANDDPLLALTWLATNAPYEAAAEWVEPRIQATDLVFLQYTSGSTGDPKGVMVSNRNLLANLALSTLTYGMEAGDVFVSWLPPHHDFGLIGAIIFPVYVGGHSVQFPAAAFLMRPYRWLKLMSDYRAKMTGAPNFAYQLCAERVTPAQKSGLDLRCLSIAVNGAERIRVDTMRRFQMAFADVGLREGAMTPAYGMAETVLLVCASMNRSRDQAPVVQRISKDALDGGRALPSAAPSGAIELAAHGRSVLDEHRIAIVDPIRSVVAEQGQIGEIWVSGPSVAQGYWNRIEASAAVFGAHLAGDDRSWLRTGDLGYAFDGELYVTGRIKEMMVVNGRNVYPQDVESTVERLSAAFRPNGCAVFCLDDESDGADGGGIVIAQEVESRQQVDAEALLPALRTELAEVHDISMLAGIVLLKPGKLPRTSSGKLQRLRCRQMYLADEFEPIWSWRCDSQTADREHIGARNEIEAELLSLWSRAFDRDDLSVTDDFFALGGHSLLAAQLLAEVNARFSTGLTLSSLFTAVTIEGLAQEVARQASRTPPAAIRIERVQHGDVSVLSFAQRRFWFLDQYKAGNAFYAVPMAFRLHGAVNAVFLERALNAVIARHAPLRTVFHVVDGVPYQTIRPVLELRLELVQLSTPGQVDADMAREAAQPFELADGPLVRARLLSLPTGECTLLVTVHHIVYDGSSTGVLVNELGEFYAALQRGTPAQLMPLPIHYLDYVAWERERFDHANVAEDIAFWKTHLAQSAPLLPLPTDRPRTAGMDGAGAAFERTLAAPLVERLNSLSRARHATLFMTLAAAMNVLLFRYTECEDFCLATLTANRPPQTDALIGNFINVVPLRATLKGSDSFYDVLESTKHHFLASYERQLPFELILNQVAPDSVAAYTPYAQVALNFHTELDACVNHRWGQETVATVSGRHADSIRHAAFDLKLEITRTSDALALVYEYSTELYDTATITRWATQFEALLEQLTDQPARPVSLHDMLTGQERAALEASWRADRVDYPVPASLTALLTRQAQRSPDATAVVCGAERLSYAQLHSQADRLARALKAIGAKPNARIGLLVERSLPMVVGVLAVVKSGAAYVPLDPTYPRQRLAYMVEDAQLSMLLTQRHLSTTLPPSTVPVLCIEDLAAAGDVDREHAVDEAVEDTLDAAAYLIYTSGSTGEPKGAMVARRGMLNLLSWFNRQFAISAEDRVLLLSSFSFDLTQKNIFSVLMVGGQLHLAPEYYDPVQLGDYLDDARITFLNCAPSAFYPLLGQRRTQALRQVFLGGEPINAALLHQTYRDAAHAPVIHNTYGPTEASDVVAFYSWDPRRPLTTVPIGKAISNTRLYVLDARLQPVMAGVTGELYVGGDGVGLGYLNRPALTAERFLPDPYAREAGERMYRTGDLVRQLPSSDLEYIGRIDHQVKLRGLRVELGEIEAALMALPEIAHALVIMREDCPGDQRLVAYVIAQESGAADALGLRSALARILPAHLVPSHIELLEAFPLTPNGKVDRRALPLPRAVAAPGTGVEPASDIERSLARIWSATLKREGIGRDDDFFALGGHSLLATQVVSQVRAELGIALTLRAVFEQRTLAALASWIAAQGDAAPPADGTRIALQRSAPDSDAPLSFAQQRLWLHAQLHPGAAVYNLPFALALSGALDVRALRRSLVEIAHRHAVMRTSFDTIDGEPCARVHAAASPSLHIHDLCDRQGAAQQARLDALIHAEIHTPFDLSAPVLPRLALVKLGAGQHVLLITMHHIVADGWSVAVLLRELTALYAACLREQPSPLPAPAYQYGDFARWQRQRFAAGAFADQLAYWRTKLDGAPGVLALPTDRPRGASASQRGGLVRFTIDPSATAALTSMAEQAQGTLFMALATLFATLLYRHTGQSDICVGAPIANRHHQELESMVGFFVNTVVLRMQLDGGSSFASLFEQVRDTAQEAYAHQDLPFDELVGALGAGRRDGQSPLFQVMLAMQNTPADVLALPGVAARELPVQTETAKFDLTLHVVPAAHGLECAFEFNADLFDSATIERWREHLRMLIAAVVAAPAAPLAQLPMLPQEQFDQVVHGFGRASSSAPAAYALLHGWFERRAAAAPSALAMVHGADTLTYAQLNRRANQLAHYLTERGVCPDDRVAVLLAPGPALLIGILGVLKAGAAYVPCDPAHPQERLAYILNDSGAVALVADAATQATAQQLAGAAAGLFTVTVEEVAAQPSLCDADPDPSAVGLGEGNLAYVIYTSGSTGRPKGVMVEHRNAVNLLQDWSQRFGADIDGRAFQAALWTSPGFDASVFEIFVPLALGGTLRPVPPEIRPDAARLMSWLVEHDIAFAYLAPFVIRHTAAMSDAQLAVLRLKHVMVGVEALMESDLYRLESLVPGLAILNAYGPTEITVYCATYTGMRHLRSTAPIGRPIANASIYLLDAHLAPVPPGVTGEIYIGGKGVARGYLNRPDLTDERFLADPFAPSGGRMYRSGDLGRWDNSGQLHYIGRNDFQLKLRGFRVEPGEIEARLRLCEGIADAAVVAHGEADAKRLVAYLVASPGEQISVPSIRAALASQLADFMIPAAFVTLPRLPLNASGKLDRFALPEPDASAFGQQLYVAPVGAIETTLAQLWCSVLEVARVGRHDNFLELGGHSLALTKLRFLVKEHFGVQLEVAQLYELQELHQLAGHIEARQLRNSSAGTMVTLDFDDDDDTVMEAA